jgi:hypothetical protein
MTDKPGQCAPETPANEITVSFVNMLPEEGLVAAVRRVAWVHDFRQVASRLERVETSGIYRARIQAEGRDGRFAHRDPHVALFGACEQLRLSASSSQS